MTEPERHNAVHPGALIIVAAALMAIGLVMVTSAAAPLDHSYVDVPLWRTVFGRQALFALIGLIVMLITARLAVPVLARPRARRWAVYAVLALAAAGLVVTFIPGWGHARHGSYRWVQLTPLASGIGFQPSELAKLALVGFLAVWFADRTVDARSFRRGFLPAAAVIGLGVLLVGKADFSTAVLLGGVGLVMLLVAGCRVRHLLLLGSIGVGGFGILLLAAPYRIARLTAFHSFW